MSTLEQLANMNAQVVIPASVLRDYLQEDRAATWMDGVQVGMRMHAARQLADLESPLNKKEAANALGIKETSLNTLIANGVIQTLFYPGISKVLIAKEEVSRVKHLKRK